jgi:SAM-dependent methyltransferase
VLTSDLVAFVRASLPGPPLRILEVGAGAGELAAALRSAGYDMTAIDPAADGASGVEPISLLDARGSFDAAVAIVSLHHLDPLERSCAHLATLVPAGAPLVVDEIDSDVYDERAAEWWLAQRRALGSSDDDHDAAEMVSRLREHVHPLAAVRDALSPWFELGEPVRVAYLHRWYLAPSLRDPELELIADGRLPAVGARFVAIRKP